MKVSELIEQAKQILEKHGDIKITTHTPGESEFPPAVALTFCVLKKSTLKSQLYPQIITKDSRSWLHIAQLLTA